MAEIEATGALEELLLQQRALVDRTVYPLLEDAPLEALVEHFQWTILGLQHQEPSFWQLQVVEFIRNVLKVRVGACIDDAVSGELHKDPAQVVANVNTQVQGSRELRDALQQLQSDVENELTRLKGILDENQEKGDEPDEHFLIQFWKKLQNLVETREKQPKSDEERGVEGVDEGFENCSFERLTFDGDFDDMSRSAMSFPCMEDFPSTILRMQSTGAVQRSAGLDELMQMPIVEIIHSGPNFGAACSAVVALFLDTEVHGEKCGMAEQAKRIIYDLMIQVEDAAQFLELYWAVLDFLRSRLETGELILHRHDVCECTDERSIAVLDCYRILHAMILRVMRHWVYFTTEALDQLLHATFKLLTIYSKVKTKGKAKRITPLMILSLIESQPLRWFKLWLLNTPSLQQLLVAVDESGFIAVLLQCLSQQRDNWTDQSGLFEQILSVTRVCKIANEVEIDEILKVYKLQPGPDDESHLQGQTTDALCHSAVRFVHDTMILNTYMQEVYKHSHEFATLNFRELLGCLSQPTAAEAFFRLHSVQNTVYQVVTELQANVGFSEALNSSDDQCPPQLRDSLGRLQWLRCCLSTQFAPSSLVLIEDSPLVLFITETLDTHVRGFCSSSCHAEDTCCVAFQMALAMVSSIPAMLECSGLFSQLKLLKVDEKNVYQRDLLYDGSEPMGSCSFLEKQLCYEFEFVGGPSEKLPQHELFDFDDHFGQIASTGVKSGTRGISDFVLTLQNKILQAIRDGAESGSSAPMDFVLISQASWELIHDLETESTANAAFVSRKSAAAFTEVFAKLIHDLAMSKRSRLDTPIRSDADMNAAADSARNGEAFFPTDSKRKLMNRLYKNYTHWLSLTSSPTALHCIVKTFGKIAMDCFPVTILMVLYPTYDVADILRFLSRCIASPSAKFFWPRSAAKNLGEVNGDIVISAVLAIAEGAEIILGREFPQILQVIDQCHCSLMSLVLRWHSQSFWNYFDWENVVIYTYLRILYGAEFQVYTIVAILKHLEPRMRELTATHSSQSLAPFLVLIREPIRNFRFNTWKSLLLRLRSGYHEEIRALLFRPG